MNDIEVSSIDLVEGGNVFKQGHYLTLGYVPRDENGETVDLSGKTLNVALWGRKGVVFEAPATFSGGVIRFTLDKTVPAAEDYTVEFTATSSTDAKYRKKFPANSNAARIAIKQSADDLGVIGISVYTVAQFQQLFDEAVGAVTEDSEVILARDGETLLGTRLAKDKQELALQLAETAKKTEVRKDTATQPINVSEWDTETKALLTGGAVAVVGENAVGSENVKPKAITPDKTDFFKSTIIESVLIKDILLYITGVTQEIQKTGNKSGVYKVNLQPNEVINITATGNDRFRIGVMNSVNETIDTAVKIDRMVVNNDSISSYTFKNDEFGKELYVYVTSNNLVVAKCDFQKGYLEATMPLIAQSLSTKIDTVGMEDQAVTIEKTDFVSKEIHTLTTVKNPFINIIDNEFGNYFLSPNSGTATTFVTPLPPNANVSIKLQGYGNSRFRAVVMNTEVSTVEGSSLLVDRVISVDDTTREVEFYNDEDGKQLVVYLSNIAIAATVEVSAFTVEYKYLRLPKGSGPEKTYALDIGTIIDNSADSLIGADEVYPTLSAVKMTNDKNNVRPNPVGWLYATPKSPHRFMYSHGKPDDLKHLCNWSKDVTWNGEGTPHDYRSFVTKEGDIINVFRGDKFGNTAVDPAARQNPIVYPNGDLSNPVIVDLGTGVKPTAWLQNSGADFIYNEDCFIFAEYTRTAHEKAYVWKVTKPFTDPNNWRVVKEFLVDRSGISGFKHCHTINYDPYSGGVVLTTGDDDDGSMIFLSKDFGETWELQLSNYEKYCRVLNLIFLEDVIYWATDSGVVDKHFLFSTTRDAEGYPIFSLEAIKELYKFPTNSTSQATYTTALIENPGGLLLLDRHDNRTTNNRLPVYFWSFETESMHVISEIIGLDSTTEWVGFRCDAVNWYQPKTDNRIVCGFSPEHFPNAMDVLGNSKTERINNLTLKVVERLTE